MRDPLPHNAYDAGDGTGKGAVYSSTQASYVESGSRSPGHGAVLNMVRRVWLLVFLVPGWLPASPALAQQPADPSALRPVHAFQARWVDDLHASRNETARRFLDVAREILALADADERRRAELLGEAQGLADLLASLDDQVEEAVAAERETRRRLIRALEARAASLRQAAETADSTERPGPAARVRELEAELEALRARDTRVARAAPLDTAAATLSALAEVVAEEQRRLSTIQMVQDELRLFLGSLRLFDETSMPPSGGGEAGGDPGAPCPPAACPISGTPGDVPLAHVRPEGPAGGDAPSETTPASLARLRARITAYADPGAAPADSGSLVPDDRIPAGAVTRETVVGASVMGFRGDAGGLGGLGPKVGTSFSFTRLLGASLQLAVEPSLGARALRADVSTVAEVAGEVREALTKASPDGRPRWQVMSWQKGRFLSEALPAPGYLEPGRAEGGVGGRLMVPLHGPWGLELEGGADALRYEPDDWKVLDRHGLNAATGLAWRGESRSARLSLRGSHHDFPHPASTLDPRRKDTRLAVEVEGALEGRVVARLNGGVSWNRSRLDAYDYRSVRGAVVLSAPWGHRSVQAYLAHAHQVYLNPGTEDRRVAPSDQDSGSILAVQYSRPLSAGTSLLLRGEWSRSVTGFQNDFYQRFGLSAHVTFRGR